MVALSTELFCPPAIPWLQAQELPAVLDLGPGLEEEVCGAILSRFCGQPDVRAVLVFGSRGRGDARADSDLDLAVIVAQPSLTPAEKASCWRRFRQLIGSSGVGVDLVVAGAADAERLSQSRWHVFGDVARQGRVLYVAG